MSNFTKPTVTIDLEEYNHLKKMEAYYESRDKTDYILINNITSIAISLLNFMSETGFNKLITEVKKKGYDIKIIEDTNNLLNSEVKLIKING